MVSIELYPPTLVTHAYGWWLYSAEAVAGMIHAELTGGKWTPPEWFPMHYLTGKRLRDGVVEKDLIDNLRDQTSV